MAVLPLCCSFEAADLVLLGVKVKISKPLKAALELWDVVQVSEGIKGLNLSKEDPVMFLPSGKMMGQERSRDAGEESWDPSTEVVGRVKSLAMEVSPDLPAGLQEWFKE